MRSNVATDNLQSLRPMEETLAKKCISCFRVAIPTYKSSMCIEFSSNLKKRTAVVLKNNIANSDTINRFRFNFFNDWLSTLFSVMFR